MDSIGALERCAYCRQYVPVTHLAVGDDSSESSESSLRATVAVCEQCRGDGR